MKEIIERIKICYYILTSHTYYVFCIDKNNKDKGCFIENYNKCIDKAIINFLNSDSYKKLKIKYGWI